MFRSKSLRHWASVGIFGATLLVAARLSANPPSGDEPAPAPQAAESIAADQQDINLTIQEAAPKAGAPQDTAAPAQKEQRSSPFRKPAASPESKPDAQRPSPFRKPDAPPEKKPAEQPVPPVAPVPIPSATEEAGWLQTPMDPPLGFTGPSGVAATELQDSNDRIPIEDRWRIGLPEWDRYGKGHQWVDDYPYMLGHWWDPYNQNVLKGDYPIIGQHTFLNITASTVNLFNYAQVPIGTTPFESTKDPFHEEFFGDPDAFLFTTYEKLTIDLNHGDAAFKPTDWRIKLTPIFNFNYFDVNELGVVQPNTKRGTYRDRNDWALEEWFIEAKLADLSPDYDFMSIRAGSQFFTSDFRGFIFSDTNRGVRLFGTRNANRDQFNVVWFDQTEKETNSLLNTFDDRHQNTLIANYYRQDFIWPGYTAQVSVHYNRDEPSFEYDRNDFLVRPDPAGVFQPHEVNAVYLGWAGDGHIGRYNVSHAFYWALGEDQLNPIAGRPVDINAMMAAIELSYDRDWARFRTSFFFSSGDDNANDGKANGFDSIFDNTQFAGGQFSYWQRQAIRLFGVNLTNAGSLVPDLRSSKFQGQSNFINPGLLLFNIGADFDVTPKFRLINNVNFLWFENTDILQTFTFQKGIEQHIGADLSIGMEYRPFLNNNMIIIGGMSTLLPGDGFEDLYNPLRGEVDALGAAFLEVVLTY